MIFSGSLSNAPFPAYCKKYPDVTKTNILSVQSPFDIESDVVGLFTFLSFCTFAGFKSGVYASLICLSAFFFAMLRRRIASADMVGTGSIACLTA
jgi:hypothetical protein